MVESSSTIPLSRPSPDANIPISRHGEVNSRASCAPPRNSPLPLKSLLKKATTKAVGLPTAASGKLLILGHSQECCLVDDQDHPHLDEDRSPFWEPLMDTMASIPTDITTSGFAPTRFSWEESFQDLSKFCSEPKAISSVTDTAICKFSQMAGVDDELNTPEIGIREDFNFDSLSKPGAYDDLCIWEVDDDPLEKVERALVPKTVDDTQILDEATDKINRNCVSLSADSTIHTSEQLSLEYKENETLNYEETAYMHEAAHSVNNHPVSPATEAMIHISPEELSFKYEDNETSSNGGSTYVIDSNMDIQLSSEPVLEGGNGREYQLLIPVHIDDSGHQQQQPQAEEHQQPRQLEMQPFQQEMNDPPDLRKQTLTKLALNLQLASDTADGLSTPDVMATLNSQEFNLLEYILDPPTPSFTVASNSAEINPDPNVPAARVEEITPNLSGSVIIKSEPQCGVKTARVARKGKRAPSYTVVSSETTTPNAVRLVIKQQPPPAPQPTRKSSRKRNSSRHKDLEIDDEENLIEQHECCSDDDFDPHLPSPSKRSRHSSTCSRESKSECSRYRELRDRNNEASRKSRMNRKAREEEMKNESARLEIENQRLRVRAEELEKIVNTLRKALLTAMVKGKN